MGIPKTRKKLDPTDTAANAKNSPAVQIVIEEADAPEAKLNKAFEIIEHMENQAGSHPEAEETAEPLKPKADEKITPGFRWRISIEAAIPQESSGHRKASPKVELAPIVNLGFTIPFLWRLPIIGNLVKHGVNRLKRFQA